MACLARRAQVLWPMGYTIEKKGKHKQGLPGVRALSVHTYTHIYVYIYIQHIHAFAGVLMVFGLETSR